MNQKTTGLTILGILVVGIMGFAIYTNTYSSTGETATSTQEQTDTPEPVATTSIPVAPSYHTGDTMTVTAHVGQSVRALGETLTPIRVVGDSRCPADVQCIWAGTVHVSVAIASGSGDSDMTFELGKVGTTEVNTIALTAVAPTKNSKQEIASGDYVFTFTVTRR